MKPSRLVALILCLSILSSLMLARCGASTSTSATTLVVAMSIDDLVTLDPSRSSELTNQYIHNSTYDTLIQIKPPDLTKLSPRLADSWEISADGTVYTFHLHPGVKFSSGNPFTGDDVKFSWTRLKNIKGNSSFVVDIVKEIEVVDANTVKVILTDSSPPFLAMAATSTLSILDSKAIREHGGTDAADADKTDTAKEWLDQHSAGTGPFILTSWQPKSEVVMEANPNYFRGKPKLSKVILKHIADPTSAVQMLQRGDVDLVNSIAPDLADQLKSDSKITLVTGQALDTKYLAMTSSEAVSKPLSNKRVRQAVVLALDYDGIIKAALKGYGIRGPSVIPVGLLGVDPNAAVGRDVAKAKALLKEAGYEKGFEVDLPYATDATHDTIAAKIKSDLAEVGISVNLKPKEYTVWIAEYREKKHPITFGTWAASWLDPNQWTDYFSFPTQGIAARMMYQNTEAQRLAKIIASEPDTAKREQAIRDIQKVYNDDAWVTMLYQHKQIIAISSSVKGFTFDPIQFCHFVDMSK